MFDFSWVEDLIREFQWLICKSTLDMLSGLLNILTGHILPFSILNDSFVKSSFNGLVVIAFAILPVKWSFEVLWAMMRDDEQNLNIYRKSLTIVTVSLVMLATPIIFDIGSSIVSSSNTIILAGNDTNTISEGVNEMLFKSFGGLDDATTKKIIKEIKEDKLDINEEDEDDNYIYDLNFFWTIVGSLIFWILLAVITLQVSLRIISLAFYKVITPLCALSLTNYNNATPFTVLRNSVLSAFILNIAQIYLLVFLTKIIVSINQVGDTWAKLYLYLAGLIFVVATPNIINSMVGGYFAGISDSLNQMSSAMRTSMAPLRMAKGGFQAVFGKPSMTGEGRYGGAINTIKKLGRHVGAMGNKSSADKSSSSNSTGKNYSQSSPTGYSYPNTNNTQPNNTPSSNPTQQEGTSDFNNAQPDSDGMDHTDVKDANSNHTPQHTAPIINSGNADESNKQSHKPNTLKSANRSVNTKSSNKDSSSDSKASSHVKPSMNNHAKRDIARQNTDFFRGSTPIKESIDTLEPEKEKIDDFKEDNDRLKSIFKRR